MAETVRTINLLPQQGESFITQLLNWTLTIGRLLIILTEMVALSTFIYRFDLDMKIVDLHDKIKGQSIIIANFSHSEENFRNLQDRLALIKQYDSVGSTTTGIFSDITNLGKNKITFRNLTVDVDSAKIEAQAASSAVLSQFVAALKNHPAVASVAIDKVVNSASNSLISVSITANLKPTAFEKPDISTQNAGAPLQFEDK